MSGIGVSMFALFSSVFPPFSPRILVSSTSVTFSIQSPRFVCIAAPKPMTTPYKLVSHCCAPCDSSNGRRSLCPIRTKHARSKVSFSIVQARPQMLEFSDTKTEFGNDLPFGRIGIGGVVSVALNGVALLVALALSGASVLSSLLVVEIGPQLFVPLK